MKTSKSQSLSTKKPSTTLHVVAAREAKPKGAADITSAASKLTPGLRLAERLRAARNERGFSLEAASQKSKVALRYVRMFEEGRYPMVADPAYLTYFVRRYAASLGLDELEASRELIAETECSTSPLRGGGSPPAETLDAEPSNAARRGRAADANHIHASAVKQQRDVQSPERFLVLSRLMAAAKPKLGAPFVLVSQLMTRRMPKLGRHSWSGPLSSRRGRHFRPGLFKFYAGPLALIAAVAMVGPFSPLYAWRDKTLPSVAKTASPLEASSAILTEATREARHEPALIAASPAVALASLPPAAEVSPPSVDASVPTAVKVAVPDVSVPHGQHLGTRRPPRVLPRSQSSTNKASDALREEQLARMRAAAAAK
jgi:transcriptional regulator with XRE-family HTH domain